LNWNGKEDTIDCLKSLKNITYPNYEVIVIDNASTDGSVEEFQELVDIKLIVNKENLGYSKGNNVGIQYAINNKADYVLILNNDTVVDPHFLSELVKIANSNEKIGILGPKTYYAEPDNMIYYAGAKINWYTGQPKHIGQKKIDDEQFNQIKNVDFVAGSCMLIKREVIEKIGMLPTDYFLLWEDIDYSVKANRNGFELVYVPSSKIWHKESVSIKKIKTYRIYYSARNRLIFHKKYATKLEYFSSTIYFILYQLPLSCLFMFIRNKNLNVISYSLKGLFQGIFYKY